MNTIIQTDPGDMMSPPTDVFTKLANDRVLFVSELDDYEASELIATLMLKECESATKKITLTINSMGADIRNIFMVYDIMQVIKAPIETICVGDAWHGMVLLLAAGTPGMRYATKSATICPSQLTSDAYFETNIKGVKRSMERIQRDNKAFITALAKHTGKKTKDVLNDLSRQQYFTAKQSKAYGIVDAII
jgi:ATP-dependent Clp protease, protease subunit